MDNVIEIKNLEVKLKKFTLSNINLNIPRGIVLGLIGRNGSGCKGRTYGNYSGIHDG